MSETRYGSVEPSKKLYGKIGTGASYSLDEVVAELVDNAIDARTPAQLKKTGAEPLLINVTITKEFIEVEDNAKGMNGQSSVGALKLGETTGEDRKLSGFGLGLKTGCLSVGNTFGIISGVEGSDERNKVQFNIQRWENDPKLGFNKPYPYEVVHKPSEAHGTTIVITDLRTNITAKKIESLIIEIGNRYRAYFKNNEVVIRINKMQAVPEKIDWAAGYPEKFELECEYGKITGTIGITKHISYKVGWGFDLFRYNRLIAHKDKFALPSEHPTFALIRGDIHLDFAPVNQTKNKFITESREYEKAMEVCRESEVFQKITKEVKDLRWNPYAKISKKLEKRIEASMEILARILDKKYRDEFKPNATVPVDSRPGRIVQVEVEQRESPSVHGEQDEHNNTHDRKRTPKHYHKVLKFKQADGKIFLVEHDWNFTEGGPRKSLVQEKHRVVVYTNQAYPAWNMTDDQNFYVMENVIDAIAEQRAVDNNSSVSRYVLEKDSFIRDLYDEKKKAKKGN